MAIAVGVALGCCLFWDQVFVQRHEFQLRYCFQAPQQRGLGTLTLPGHVPSPPHRRNKLRLKAIETAATAAVSSCAMYCLDTPSFLTGLVTGVLGSAVTLIVITLVFFGNLRDRNGIGASGGVVMPTYLLEGLASVFSKVREDTEQSMTRFKETGEFHDIYQAVSLSEQGALLQSLEALRDRFPRSATRELLFGSLRWAALSSTKMSAALYEFALRMQPASNLGASNEIFTELWALDENRCAVSGRRLGEGKQPWVNPNAEILVDQQLAALRCTTADRLQRPLFAHVAPEILARPTYLSLIRLFDLFQHPVSCAEGVGCRMYSDTERQAIDQFLEAVVRTPVMRRAYSHVVGSLQAELQDSSWQEVLRELWFQRWEGRPSVFEHVFLGNLTEDLSGEPIAGGLHCWVKFYLEELRGTAKYLGYIYNDPEVGFSDNRFVSGKFIWDHQGYKLVKDQGGFFVGVSPEWQLACGTVAYFETRHPEHAHQHGWQTWPEARNLGFTKDVTHGRYRYRHVVCSRQCPDASTGYDTSCGTVLADELCTSYAAFLGRECPAEAEDASELDRALSPAELAAWLPAWVVAEGIAAQEGSELCRECVRFSAARGCRSLREALASLRQALTFDLEDAVMAARAPGNPHAHEDVDDAAEVAEIFLKVAEGTAALSVALPQLFQRLRDGGRRGPRIHKPLRLLLTGRVNGASVAEIVRLLELLELEGGDEAGVKLQDRIKLIRALFLSSSTTKAAVAVAAKAARVTMPA